MNIAFDATAMLDDKNQNTDKAAKTYKMIEKIIALNLDCNFYCLNLYNKFIHTIERLKEISIYSGVREELIQMPKYKKVLGKVVADFISEYKINVFYITDPFCNSIMTYEKEWFNDTIPIAMVYSILEDEKKEEVFVSRNVQRKYEEGIKILHWVHKCVPLSYDVQDKLIRKLDIPARKILADGNCCMMEVSECIKKPIRVIRKLAIFTPLPPIQSGIADYIIPIIKGLSHYFDIDLFIDNGYKPIVDFPSNVKVYRHYEFSEKHNQYDEILYEMGGSTYHIYMFDYVKEFPGIVDLHDCNMNMVLYHKFSKFVEGGTLKPGRGFCRYFQALAQEIGEVDAMRSMILRLSYHTSGTLAENVVNGFVVDCAKKVIVRDRFSAEILAKRNILTNVDIIPTYADRIEHSMIKNDDEVKFYIMGHADLTKRHIPILKAFEKLLVEGDEIKLVIVGDLHGYDEMYKKCLEKETFKGKLEVTGYVDENKFTEHLINADVLISLRYPYYGGGSGIHPKALGMGKCSIVNNVGYFADLPDDVCVKIPNVEEMSNSEEVDQIYYAMKKLLNKDERNRISNKAYEYAKKELNMNVAVGRYLSSITNVKRPPLTNSELKFLLRNDKTLGGWV